MSIKTGDVFGVAESVRASTYVDRGGLDEELLRMIERNQQHVTIHGPSKCGKSWLRQHVLNNPLVVQCLPGRSYKNIYIDALSQLGISVCAHNTQATETKGCLEASTNLGSGFLGKIGLSGRVDATSTDSCQMIPIGQDPDDISFFAKILLESKRKLVVEDFHYMSEKDREAFAYDLKALWDCGVRLVVIGIWPEVSLLTFLNHDLAGRVHDISVEWKKDELAHILDSGGDSLNIVFGDKVKSRLCENAYSNAGLLQALALGTLDQMGIYEKEKKPTFVNDVSSVEDASMLYAEQLRGFYQTFSERMAKGIRCRKRGTDIYAHTMAALLDHGWSDEDLIRGITVDQIFEIAHARQPRIQKVNMITILQHIPSMQLDEKGNGLIINYDTATNKVFVVNRELLFYRKYVTINWPWEDLIQESELDSRAMIALSSEDLE